jgi:SSS family solute:Na+ symporter
VLTVVADVPRTTGIVLSAVVMTVYFVAGGLLSSAWINAVQLVVLLIGFAVALPMVISSAGGMTQVLAPVGAPEGYASLTRSTGPGSGWMLMFALVPAFIISPGLMQKAYGASSERAVRAGIGWQALALALFAFIPALFGMAARATNPGITDPNLVLPTVLAEQLPVTLGALGLAAVFSAEVSTCDALLFMLATSLSQDMYKRFLRPQATDNQLLFVARVASVAGALGGVLFALWLPTVTDALRIFYSVLGVSVLVPVVGGLYTRAGPAAALISIAAGTGTLLVATFALAARFPWLDATLAGLVAAAVAYATVNAFSARARPQVRSRPGRVM